MSLVIDAKNSRYTLSDSKPNVDQMRSYMATLNGKYGIFVHSESDDPAFCKEIINEKDDQKIIWTSLLPGNLDTVNAQNLENIIQIIQKHLELG
jgi:hypothetical protein